MAELQRKTAESRRLRREQTSRTHDRLIVVIWFTIYVPLLGGLVFMAMHW